MVDYRNIIKNRELRLKMVRLLEFIPNNLYLKLVFFIKTGKRLNLKNPVGFNEKENWLKVNDVHYEYSKYVDKVAVREFVTNTIGEQYLFPLLGTWQHFDDIDFDSLPDEFVLKCNHDSGSVKIIRDKSKINKDEMRKFYESRLKINSYVIGREYPYREVKPCILAEKLMKPSEGEIADYKFFCFDGVPKLMFVATDRSTDCKFDFYDMEFHHLDITNIHPQSGKCKEKPKCFDDMIEVAGKLSKGFKFVRVDLYCIDEEIYFGELTFFHGGGFWLFHPDEWEYRLGGYLNLE